MRIFNKSGFKWDKRFLIACLIALILAIICGIVLYTTTKISSYIYNFADNYIFFIFNFQNGQLFISHFFTEIFFLYFAFLIARFTKLKIIAIPVMFLRTLFIFLYTALLCALFATEGVIVVILVFLPSFVCSVLAFIFLCEQSSVLCAPLAYFIPAILALINSLLFLLLINVPFRVMVVIV